MEKCHYTWYEWNVEKGKFITDQCSEEIWESSRKYCIFHDPSSGKDMELFEQELQKKLDSEDYNFRSYYFPADVDFSSKKFGKDVCFDGATFKKNAYFSGANFQNAYFNGVTFRNAYFNEVTFQYASFFGAVIERDLQFSSREIGQLNFQNVRFLLRGYISANMIQAKLRGAELENVIFLDCKWPKKVYEEMHMEDEGLSYNELETIYRDLKQNMQRHGDYSTAGEFYFREMECRKNAMREKRFSANWFKSFGYSLLKYTCGYGEKPGWVIRNSLLIILLGAILFFFSGVARVGADIPSEDSPYIIDYSLDSLDFSKTTFTDFYYCSYFSAVTFTTLGYGDVHPIGYYSHAIASSEAFTGAFFMALFVVVIARKMMR